MHVTENPFEREETSVREYNEKRAGKQQKLSNVLKAFLSMQKNIKKNDIGRLAEDAINPEHSSSQYFH